MKRIARQALNTLVEVIEARKALQLVSHRPWRDALSAGKREGIRQSRLSFLPPVFKRSPSFVVDVGANEGQWIFSLRKVLPLREAWIFEPNPEALAICQSRLGPDPGIRYFGTALGQGTGSLTLRIPACSDFGSVLVARKNFISEHYGASAAVVSTNLTVPVCALDSIVPESKSVDLLKIDVQGFEGAVLAGSRRVLASTRTVLIEVNLQSHYIGDDTFPALWSILADQGFSFYRLSTPFTGNHGIPLWADAVFVRGDPN